MDPQYEAAMAASYANQEGGVTIPAEQLGGIVEVTLGFQPLGISSRTLEDGSDQIAVAAYFEPAVCTSVVRKDTSGLHFDVSWIRGCNHGVQSVRIFPGFLGGEANRCQTVNFGPSEELWVTRNGDREIFVLSPPTPPSTRWTLTSKFRLPGEGMVHSLHRLSHGDLLTIESTMDLSHWGQMYYKRGGGEYFPYTPMERLPKFTYGVVNLDAGGLWTVTDFRSSEEPGIYDHRKRIVPDVVGNGICFLSDGSALVTRYGQAFPGAFNGIPGTLIYVPAHMFGHGAQTP